ncbi:hypothetical protein M3Y97_00472000 [Aphelenchoides bicaudatus]|nr:hypothetical protein M3Y97_00472000 [Aphelenchoides bicaudatus]
MDEFDEIGNAKTVLMDCELAAQNALEIVFPEWSVRSCSFHFAKNVLDYAKNNGLSETLENSEFAVWTKEILGCIFLPELYMNEVFAYLLDSPPFNDKHVKKFVKYLRNYWSKKLHKLCVWENNYPRTTNIAEGYNNGLQTSFEHETHPAFRKAFDVHVDDLNKNAYDYLRLQDGVDRLCLRKPIARKVDENLMEARIKLADYLTKLHENDDTISIEDLLQ